MGIQKIIEEIRTHLAETFSAIDRWFDEPEAVRTFYPPGGGWNVNQVLEHIALTNHFLLLLIEKGTTKALKRAASGDSDMKPENYVFQKDRLDEVGIHGSFKWIRPEHMEPKGEKSTEEVRIRLKKQASQCSDTLKKLKNREGILCTTTMSVNDLGKIDVYEYIYFLSQHGRRHISQMEKIKAAYPHK